MLDTVGREGTRVFLDLKLHDILNTVAKALSAASTHGIDLLTIHTTGGMAMMKAAAAAAGATLLVVGRPITQAAAPAEAARRIVGEIAEALGETA